MNFGRAYRVIDRACRVIDMQPPWKYIHWYDARLETNGWRN